MGPAGRPDARRADRGGGCPVALLAAADRAAHPGRAAGHVRRHGARRRHQRRVGDDPGDGDGDAADGQPEACSPLVQATVANRFPDAALDGVGTYWWVAAPPSRCSRCVSPTPSRPRPSASGSAPRSTPARIEQIIVRRTQRGQHPGLASHGGRTAAGTGGPTISSATPSEGRAAGRTGLMAIQLMPYLNTISWQYRYESGSTLVLDAAGRPADAVPALSAGVDRRRPTEVTRQAATRRRVSRRVVGAARPPAS